MATATTVRRFVANGLLALNRLVGSTRSAEAIADASALVFAPHPDDEVLGCGGVIALKARAGTRVQVVVMTDGRASHASLMDPDRLAGIRRAEAEEARRELGLSEPYVFLDFHDQGLANSRDAACERVADLIGRFNPTEIDVANQPNGVGDHDETSRTVLQTAEHIGKVADLIGRFNPTEIYIPSRREGIGDHDETNRIVLRAVERVGKPVVVLEFPVWLWNGWPWTGDGARRRAGLWRGVLRTGRDVTEIVLACRRRVDVRSVLSRKRAALGVYRSQMERLNGNPRWRVLADVAGGEFLGRFESGVEIFRCTRYRPGAPRAAARAGR